MQKTLSSTAVDGSARGLVGGGYHSVLGSKVIRFTDARILPNTAPTVAPRVRWPDYNRSAHSAARTLVRMSVEVCWHDFGLCESLT